MDGYDTIGDGGLGDGSQLSTSATTNDPPDLSLAGGEGTPDLSLAGGEGTPDTSLAEGDITPDPNVAQGDGTPEPSLADGDVTSDPHPTVAFALASDALPDIEPLSGVPQTADGVVVMPEDTITGPPADFPNDPELLKAWNAMSQGIDDAQAGAPFNPPVDLTGDQTTADAYELGYRTTTGEWQLPAAAPQPDFSNLPEIRPSTPSEINAPPWDGLTPLERQLLRIAEFRGISVNPDLPMEETDRPRDIPPPTVPPAMGPAD